MSITDELRHEVAEYPFRDNRDFALFEAVADRIDAEHQKAMDEWKARDDQMWLKGYEECHAELLEGNETIAYDLEECGLIRLPKDADGEYIHVGDVMEGFDKYDSLKKVMGKVITVSFEADGLVDVAVQAWNGDGKSWRRAYLDPDASVYRHHHELTVEDVLREFTDEVWNRCCEGATASDSGIDELVAEYATKLRLAEEDK